MPHVDNTPTYDGCEIDRVLIQRLDALILAEDKSVPVVTSPTTIMMDQLTAKIDKLKIANKQRGVRSRYPMLTRKSRTGYNRFTSKYYADVKKNWELRGVATQPKHCAVFKCLSRWWNELSPDERDAWNQFAKKRSGVEPSTPIPAEVFCNYEPSR